MISQRFIINLISYQRLHLNTLGTRVGWKICLIIIFIMIFSSFNAWKITTFSRLVSGGFLAGSLSVETSIFGLKPLFGFRPPLVAFLVRGARGRLLRISIFNISWWGTPSRLDTGAGGGTSDSFKFSFSFFFFLFLLEWKFAISRGERNWGTKVVHFGICWTVQGS